MEPLDIWDLAEQDILPHLGEIDRLGPSNLPPWLGDDRKGSREDDMPLPQRGVLVVAALQLLPLPEPLADQLVV